MLSSGNRLWLQSRGVTPAMAGLLHQHRLLAAHIGDAHVSFADLMPSSVSRLKSSSWSGLVNPECIGDGAEQRYNYW